MKLSLGLDGADTPEMIGQFAAAGADEFFAGFVPPDWFQRYGWEIPLNRRAFGPHCQYIHHEELAEVISAIHTCGKRVFVTFNHHAYCDEQVSLLREIIGTVDRLKPDGYIVADPALLLLLRAWGNRVPLHLSTGTGCFNSETVRHLCRLADGVRRVVIPRKMTLREMRAMMAKLHDLELQFEVMVIGYRCFFNDEFCFSLHSGAIGNLCCDFCNTRNATSRRYPHNWKRLIEETIADLGSQFQAGSALDQLVTATAADQRMESGRTCGHQPRKAATGMSADVAGALFTNCGLCAIPRLRQIGVDVLKIPARGSAWQKARHLEVVRAVADHPDPSPEFCRRLIGSPDFCASGGHCYYDLSGGPLENG